MPEIHHSEHYKFHVNARGKRTTVNVDGNLLVLLALKLGLWPNHKDTHKRICDWIQEKVNMDPEVQYNSLTLSKIVRQHMHLEIVDEELFEKYREWLMA